MCRTRICRSLLTIYSNKMILVFTSSCSALQYSCTVRLYSVQVLQYSSSDFGVTCTRVPSTRFIILQSAMIQIRNIVPLLLTWISPDRLLSNELHRCGGEIIDPHLHIAPWFDAAGPLVAELASAMWEYQSTRRRE